MYSSNGTNGVASSLRVVDLRSDTVSVPTPNMRRAIYDADVGDDVYGEDPTTSLLERRSAELFGKEAALFVPSGTMGNLLAVMVHCNRRGSEAIVGDMAHVFLYEQGGSAQLAGVSLNNIKNLPDGTFSLDELQTKFRGFDVHEPKTELVLIENTHNICGGKVIPLQWIEDLAKICKKESVKVHMDGARVFNAAEHLGVPVSRIVRDVDSICCCLSKGLACPVGSVLVGSKEFIKQAHRLRKALGGGMRQVGFLAAAGLVALDEIVPLLNLDHQRARKIAEAIHAMKSPLFTVDLKNVQTNILMVQILTDKIKSDEFARRLANVSSQEIADRVTDTSGKGISVKLSARDWAFVRIVTYTNLTNEDVDLAIRKIKYVIEEYQTLLN